LRNRYKINLEAKDDLKRIYSYGFYRWGEQQADFYFNQIFECFSDISMNPKQFPKVDEIRKSYRRCVCGVDTIYFRIDNDMIEIMRILGSQDIKDTF